MGARLWVWWTRARLVTGAWIMGRDLLAVWTLLWLIRDRARTAVHEDGRVDLAECAALADALYRQVPGHVALSVTWKDGAA